MARQFTLEAGEFQKIAYLPVQLSVAPGHWSKVSRATADILTGSAVPVFTVSGGRVLVTLLLGEVTTILAAGTTPDLKFISNPTTGTTTDMCAVLNVASDEVGTMYSLHGAPATALQRGESGSVPGMTTNGIAVAVGAIEAICDENITGSIKLDLWFLPLDTGATVVAA